MIFALCGGDGRQARLAGLLLADGHSVRTWALERAELPEPARRCRSAAEALDGADCLLLPMPVSAKSGLLNAPLSGEGQMCIRDRLKRLGIAVDMICGFRSKDIVIMEDEFRAASDNLYITTDDGSYGEAGFVTTKLKALLCLLYTSLLDLRPELEGDGLRQAVIYIVERCV